MDNIIDTYITTNAGIATMLIIFVVLLKVFINREVTQRHLKKMLVSIPGEITFLLIGFLISAIIDKGENDNSNVLLACMVIAFIMLAIQYALERWLDDKLSGKLEKNILICIIVMYVMSIILYTIIVFGGVC